MEIVLLGGGMVEIGLILKESELVSFGDFCGLVVLYVFLIVG